MEQTLVLIKPDGVQRGLVGEIIRRFERKGLKIVAIKMMRLDDVVLKEHYAHLISKPFYAGIEKFMMKDPVIAICLEGLDVVNAVRLIAGITKAREAAPGTIRGDFGMSVACNVIHASDSVNNAKSEIKRFFNEEDLFDYDKTEFEHVYIDDER
jgi:nucleoside-diphosphate kinase